MTQICLRLPYVTLKEKTKQLMKEKAFTEYFESVIQRIIDDKEEFSIKAVSTQGSFWAEIDFPEDYDPAADDYDGFLDEE